MKRDESFSILKKKLKGQLLRYALDAYYPQAKAFYNASRSIRCFEDILISWLERSPCKPPPLQDPAQLVLVGGKSRVVRGRSREKQGIPPTAY